MEASKLHIPVLLKEVIELTNPQRGDVVIDGTLGMGGHAEAFLKRIAPDGLLIGLDKSPESLEIAKKRLEGKGQFLLFNRGFEEIRDVVESLGLAGRVDIILLDLGLSSFLLEHSGRGFSFKRDEPLDMRFSPSSGYPAEYYINTLDEKSLEKIIREYGEEPLSRRIARKIVENRPIRTTQELVRAIEMAVPRRFWNRALKRTFQAFRIYVNRELDVLKFALNEAVSVLKPGGRLAVISYHSLEDRIVKQFSRRSDLRRITRKPVVPSEDEIARNPRSRSAKLRVMEKL